MRMAVRSLVFRWSSPTIGGTLMCTTVSTHLGRCQSCDIYIKYSPGDCPGLAAEHMPPSHLGQLGKTSHINGVNARHFVSNVDKKTVRQYHKTTIPRISAWFKGP